MIVASTGVACTTDVGTEAATCTEVGLGDFFSAVTGSVRLLEGVPVSA